MGGLNATGTSTNSKRGKTRRQRQGVGTSGGSSVELGNYAEEASMPMRDLPLTPKETKMFDILKRVGEKHEVNVRIAGGWVRDKLLGRNSKDIDITVDKMTGAQFAKLVAKELGMPEDSVKIMAATETMKLETAKMNIDGQELDFANLRKETYNDKSRNPEAVMGTAEDDAFRRDLNINALHYNLHTGQVEDHTGKGIQDLRDGVIRTPLEGSQTFIDDPLRPLRAVRFSGRYGFAIAPETEQAMADPAVHQAFKDKNIPLDRLRKEIDESLLTNPVDFVKKIADTKFAKTFLPELLDLDMDQRSPYHDKTVLNHTVALLEYIHQKDPTNLQLKFAALFHDFGKPSSAKPSAKDPNRLMFMGHEEKSAKMAEEILKRLRYDNATIKRVVKLVGNHGFSAPIEANDLKFNRWMLEHAKTKQEWDDLMLLREADIHGSAPSTHEKEMGDHQALLDRARQSGVERILTMKPYVDGNEIKQLLNQDKPGKWIGEVNQQLMDKQLSGDIKNKEDAIAYLQGRELTPDGKLVRRTEMASGLKKVGAIHQAIPNLAKIAQKEYDTWEVDENGQDPELGEGGICQDIADGIASHLAEMGIDAAPVTAQVGEQHVFVLAKLHDGVYEVDIPPSVYETGGGYNWKKIPGVKFTRNHFVINKVSENPDDFDEMTGEGY